MKKEKLTNDTMKEYELKRVFIYQIKARYSKTNRDKEFVKTDNREQGGTDWTVFYIKDNKSFYFDLSGGQPYTFSLNQIPTPVI